MILHVWAHFNSLASLWARCCFCLLRSEQKIRLGKFKQLFKKKKDYLSKCKCEIHEKHMWWDTNWAARQGTNHGLNAVLEITDTPWGFWVLGLIRPVLWKFPWQLRRQWVSLNITKGPLIRCLDRPQEDLGLGGSCGNKWSRERCGFLFCSPVRPLYGPWF